MGFRAEHFARATLAPRTREVPVPELADWFDGETATERKAAAVFIVRGLSADEYALAKDAHLMNMRKLGLLKALEREDPDPNQIAEEARAAIRGSAEDKHAQIAFRQEMIRHGVVDPVLSEEAVAKLAAHFAMLIFRISDAINDLTGRGSEAAKKPKRSSQTAPSETV
jgi:hypothetical protein